VSKSIEESPQTPLMYSVISGSNLFYFALASTASVSSMFQYLVRSAHATSRRRQARRLVPESHNCRRCPDRSADSVPYRRGQHSARRRIWGRQGQGVCNKPRELTPRLGVPILKIGGASSVRRPRESPRPETLGVF
jgi:hypothetical protein